MFVLLVIILALMVSALGPASPSPTNGEEVFKRVCATCHTIDRPTDMEADKPAAPPMKMVVRRYMMVNESEEAAHARIVTWLEGPKEDKSIMPPMAIAEHGLMPPVVLTEEERNAVASYVLTLHEPGMPAMDGMPGMNGMPGMRHHMPNPSDTSKGMGVMGLMGSGQGMNCDHMNNPDGQGNHSCPGMDGEIGEAMPCKSMKGENGQVMPCKGMNGEKDQAMQCPNMKTRSSEGDS